MPLTIHGLYNKAKLLSDVSLIMNKSKTLSAKEGVKIACQDKLLLFKWCKNWCFVWRSYCLRLSKCLQYFKIPFPDLGYSDISFIPLRFLVLQLHIILLGELQDVALAVIVDWGKEYGHLWRNSGGFYRSRIPEKQLSKFCLNASRYRKFAVLRAAHSFSVEGICLEFFLTMFFSTLLGCFFCPLQ